MVIQCRLIFSGKNDGPTPDFARTITGRAKDARKTARGGGSDAGHLDGIVEGDFGLSGKTTDVRVAADEEAIMTLAMTVIAPWGICQCSDCRLTDKSTNPPTVTDDRSIKHVSVMVPDGFALITYTGAEPS